MHAWCHHPLLLFPACSRAAGSCQLETAPFLFLTPRVPPLAAVMRQLLAQLLPRLPDVPLLPKDQWRVVIMDTEPGDPYYCHPVRTEQQSIMRHSLDDRVLTCATLQQVRRPKAGIFP